MSANGLVSPLGRGAYIYTGIDTGYIRVSASALDGPPGVPDAESWEEIIEVSVRARRGDLRIRAFEDEPRGLPRLNERGPGWYRCRVHARGRDTDIDGTADVPFEHYLVEVWADAGQAAPIVHRSTDRYGAELRDH